MICTFKLQEDKTLDVLSLQSGVVVEKVNLWEVVLPEIELGVFLRNNVDHISIVDLRIQRKDLETLLVDAIAEDKRQATEMGVLA